MNNQTAVFTEGLVKSYGKVRALKGVDLQVRSGEIFGFLGPNGAGKTTTIRCLLDMIRPDTGTLRVLGIDPQQNPVEVRRRVGYLPGELHMDPNMKVEGALHFLNKLRDNRADWSYVIQLAEKLNLDMKIQIKNLSKGNKQKAGVVQALMHKPELLMLDEPTFGLDPLIQQEVLGMVSQAREEGATVFFSSHILSEVQEIADRVAIIRRGEVIEVADTRSLIERSFKRARVMFKEAVDTEKLDGIPGVSVLSRDDGMHVTLQVEGEMDGLIKSLSAFPVLDFETERPSLEEIFLAYYKE